MGYHQQGVLPIYPSIQGNHIHGIWSVPNHLVHWGVPRVIVDLATAYNCTTPGSFPDKTDCSRFFTCNDIGGKLVGFTFDCPPGLLFNSTAQLCDWPERVECLPVSISEEITDTVATRSVSIDEDPEI